MLRCYTYVAYIVHFPEFYYKRVYRQRCLDLTLKRFLVPECKRNPCSCVKFIFLWDLHESCVYTYVCVLHIKWRNLEFKHFITCWYAFFKRFIAQTVYIYIYIYIEYIYSIYVVYIYYIYIVYIYTIYICIHCVQG